MRRPRSATLLKLFLLEDRLVPAGFQSSDPYSRLTDSDQDSLPDTWERNGVDINNDGIIDLNLPAMGASPNRKDIFIEADAMRGRVPESGAIQKVVRAFSNAPVSNPDGSTGITLHVQLDETSLPLRDYDEYDDTFLQGFAEDRAQYFGTERERTGVNSAQVLAAKELVFRYMIFANTYGGTDSSGLAHGVPGNEFVVTLGGWNTPGGTLDQQAGTFMHELGHTLGLRHRGDQDRPNPDPTYHSIMTYAYQTEPDEFPGSFPDYSRDSTVFFDWANLRYNFRDPNAPPPSVLTTDPNFDPSQYQQTFITQEPSILEQNPELGAAAFAVAPDVGNPIVIALDQDGKENFRFTAYDKSFTGGVRVATADVTGDGINDVITAPGPGMPVLIRVFSGVDATQENEIQAFETSFTGGAYVATSDIDGDGYADIIVSADQGGGPRIRIFSGFDNSLIVDFFGIDDENFRGGCRVTVADLNGDGWPDLLVGAGFGGGPRVALFDGFELADRKIVRIVGDFFAFEQSLRNGVFLSAGDINSDGYADLVFGGGPGGGPRIMILDGDIALNRGLDRALAKPLANFFAGDAALRGGVRVTMANRSSDGSLDLIVGGGEKTEPRLTIYKSDDLINAREAPDPIQDELVFTPSFGYGIFVG